MRMRLPQGCLGVVHAGRPLAVTSGAVTVDPAAAADLLAHGLEPVAEARVADRAGKPEAKPDAKPDAKPERRQR